MIFNFLLIVIFDFLVKMIFNFLLKFLFDFFSKKLFVSSSQPKQSDVEWLLRVVLQTLQKAARYKLLFQYVPEYYVLTAINTYNALFNFFDPTVPFESLDSKYVIMLKSML